MAQQWQTPAVLKADSVENISETVHRLTFIYGTRRYLKKMESEEHIRLETAIHAVLLEHGVRIAALLPTCSGERWAENDGQLYVLSDELDGVITKEVQPCEAILYGYELAKLHQAMLFLENGGQYPEMNLAQQLEKRAIPRTLEAAEENNSREAIEQLVSEMTSSWFPTLELIPKQLIHRDAHPGNMILAEDGTVGFLDFEISVSGIRLFDVCYFCTSQWIGEYSKQKSANSWISLVTKLRQGYEKLSPLSNLEKSSAFFVMCAIQMIFISFWHGRKRPDLLETNLEALLGLLRNRSNIDLVFGIGQDSDIRQINHKGK